MSERLNRNPEVPTLDTVRFGELVHDALARLSALWPARPAGETEIDWEDGEPRGDNVPN